MWRTPNEGDEGRLAVLAVLAAAAREAEELLAQDEDELEPETVREAERRLRLFMVFSRSGA